MRREDAVDNFCTGCGIDLRELTTKESQYHILNHILQELMRDTPAYAKEKVENVVDTTTVDPRTMIPYVPKRVGLVAAEYCLQNIPYLLQLAFDNDATLVSAGEDTHQLILTNKHNGVFTLNLWDYVTYDPETGVLEAIGKAEFEGGWERR